LSNVKSWAVITALSLNIKVKDTAGSPTPIHELWYSASDSWTRAMNPQPADVSRTVAVSSTFAPTTVNNYQSVGLSLAAHNFQNDLVDGTVTLGVRCTVTPPAAGFSYTQYFSSDTAGQRPQLIITTCE
jgi:hypothetical protein